MLAHSPRVRTYLELVRLPNLFTAVGDIVAGYLIVSRGANISWRDLIVLTIASVCLYAGGVVLNDYFDRDVDAVERPERPIPSGRIDQRDVLKLGTRLLALGCVFAVGVGVPSLIVAVLLAGCIWLYDSKGKRIEYVGSANMGACRFLNVVLGASGAPGAAIYLPETWLWFILPTAFLIFLYIAAVTLLATGEVWGGNRTISSAVFAAVVVVIGGVLWLGFSDRLAEPVYSYPFLAVFAVATLGRIGNVVREPAAPNIRIAIKTCVLSLLLLDAAIAAGAGGIWFGLGVAVLIFPALYAARLYAVT
ncbi:MAG: UbiA-like protein EboC [Chloroflexi bacterium]|nr:UbiA-like protein EboC [Chloroflexota bacterium]